MITQIRGKITQIFIVILFLTAPLCFAQDFPPPRGYVNDFADILSNEYETKLNAFASELENKTTSQIAIVTIDSIKPYEIEDYAVRLFEKWGIGKKGKDNGVLILLALSDRNLRIEVGYGLEGAIPDAIAKQ
ncbi:MAG: TPM domain-containing protein, partial [Candidatus Omnitrophica bacterium]|nr:TPM domain-containing protein [Candidatus Omnitrophota bacterium]